MTKEIIITPFKEKLYLSIIILFFSIISLLGHNYLFIMVLSYINITGLIILLLLMKKDKKTINNQTTNKIKLYTNIFNYISTIFILINIAIIIYGI